MKMNSKGLLLSLSVLALVAQSANAGPLGRKGSGERKGSSGSAPGTPSGGNTETRPPAGKVIVQDQVRESCPQVTNSEALSEEFLKNLYADDTAKISMEITPEGKFKYEIPRHYKACGEIILVPEKISGSSDYQVSVVLRKDGANQTHDQIIECIQNNGKLVDGNIDHDSIEYGDYSSKIVSPASNPLPGFSKEVSSRLYYKWPSDFNSSNNYPTKMSSEYPRGINDVEKSCFAYHKGDSVRGYLTERDLWLEKVEKACQGEGKAEEILKLKKEIKGIRSLADMMDQISQALDGQYVLKALEDAETNFMKPLSEMESKISGPAIKDRIRLIAEVNKYEELMKKMERELVEPIQARINELIAKSSAAEDHEKLRIDEEITKLKEGLAKLLRSSGANYNATLQRLANEGISTQAKTVMVINEKIKLYTQLNEDKIKSFAEVSKRLKKYDVEKTEMTNLWKDLYSVRTGDKEPLERNARLIQNETKRLQVSWEKTQESMRKKINKDCSGLWVNQQKCQKAIQAAYKEKAQAEKALTRKSQGVQGLYKKREMLYDGYTKYKEEQEAQTGEESEDDTLMADLGSESDLMPSWFSNGSSSSNMSNMGYAQNGIPMGQMPQQQNYGGMSMNGMGQLGTAYGNGMSSGYPMMYGGSAMGYPMQ